MSPIASEIPTPELERRGRWALHRTDLQFGHRAGESLRGFQERPQRMHRAIGKSYHFHVLNSRVSAQRALLGTERDDQLGVDAFRIETRPGFVHPYGAKAGSNTAPTFRRVQPPRETLSTGSVQRKGRSIRGSTGVIRDGDLRTSLPKGLSQLPQL